MSIRQEDSSAYLVGIGFGKFTSALGFVGAYLFIHPVLAFVFLVVFLYLNLGFKRFINVFLKIHSHLKNEGN